MIPIYGQVSTASGNDPDSSPGNGNAPNPNEDDEAVVNFNGGTPPSLADLNFQSLSFVFPPTRGFEPFSYQFEIRNDGATISNATSFEVNAFISSDPTISPDDISVGTFEFFGLASNDFKRQNGGTTLPNLANGSYYLIVEADPTNSIGETNESNNTRALPFTIGNNSNQPDLTLQNLALTDLTVRTGEVLNYTFDCLLYTSPSPRDRQKSRMPSSA